MKIGIYARGLSEKSGGVKEYITSLTKSMIKSISKEDELFIIHNLGKKLFQNKLNTHEVLLSSQSKIVCDFIISPKVINKLHLDVILFPKGTIPYFVKTPKQMLTVHDLAYFLPKYNAYKWMDNIYMKLMTRSSCKRADKIIAISENTKKDIVNILNIPADKFKVIYEAADKRFRKLTDKTKVKYVKEKFSLNNEFIFYSGSISPRKNIKRLISAFKTLKTSNLDLVITGNMLWNSQEEVKLIKNNPRIKLLGLVSDDELIALYSLAKAYVYPSLYEGFGLPILEAQACGCPVITSNISSMPEVAGKGAILVNPYKVDEIATAMEKVLKDKELRDKLIKEGYKNVNRFSWEKCARKTLKVCEDVCNEK